ncbi:MAG: PAS domain-containing sensor histidine kinase [Methanomicrobiales archaeon]
MGKEKGNLDNWGPDLKEYKEIISNLEQTIESQQKLIDESVFNEEFLSVTALELVELSPSEDIYEFIATKLNELIEDSTIVITRYHQPSDSFQVKSVIGESKRLNEFSRKSLGINLFNIQVPIKEFNQAYDEKEKERILSGKLHVVQKGLYQVLCCTIPERMTKIVEKSLNIGIIYGSGFQWKGQLYGTVNIFLKKGNELNNPRMVQALIRLFSVTLQKRKAENEFLESEETYKNLFRKSFDAWMIHSKGIILDGNQAAVEIMGGTTIDDFKGRPLMEFVHPDYRDEIYRRISSMYKKGGILPLTQEKFLKLDKTPLTVEVVATSLKYDGKNAVQVVFRDITQRENLLKTLQHTKEELERIIESSPSAVAVFDLQGGVKHWSPSAEKIFGWSEDEVLGKLNPTIPPEYAERFQNQLEIIRQGKSLPLLELDLITRDGTRIYASLSVAPLMGADGKVEEILAIMDDITQRKMAELQLKDSENRYRTIFENTGAATILFNKDGLITLANSEMEKLLDYNKDDVVGKRKWMEFIHPDDLPIMLKYHQMREKDPLSAPNSYETRIIDFSDKVHNTRITVDKIPGIDEYVTSVIDITDLKNAYTHLEESENRFRLMFENIPVPYQSLDPNGLYLDVNEPLCQLLGYDKKDILGRSFKDFWSPETQKQFGQKCNYLKEKGWINNMEIELMDNKGDKRIVLLTGRVQKDPKTAESIRSHCILNDITERKQMMDQLQKSLDEKEMLLKEIHHRVKNNLMIISSLLNLQSYSIKDEAARGVFRESQNRARSMALIHDRLYRSTDLKRINFGDYIRNLSNELYQTYVMDSDRVKLVLNVEDEMIDINTAIPLGLILNELLANAMKYAYPEGKIGDIKVFFNKVYDEYILRVKDEGVGIPSDLEISKVKTLGLQLIYNLTDQIDGELELNRKNGTDFKIIFKEAEYAK